MDEQPAVIFWTRPSLLHLGQDSVFEADPQWHITQQLDSPNEEEMKRNEEQQVSPWGKREEQPQDMWKPWKREEDEEEDHRLAVPVVTLIVTPARIPTILMT
jgi:hypothetical protein